MLNRIILLGICLLVCSITPASAWEMDSVEQNTIELPGKQGIKNLNKINNSAPVVKNSVHIVKNSTFFTAKNFIIITGIFVALVVISEIAGVNCHYYIEYMASVVLSVGAVVLVRNKNKLIYSLNFR